MVAKVLMWGPGHVMVYNDTYARIAGEKHPDALGSNVAEVWPEIWDWNRDIIEAGLRGELRFYHDQSMILIREGRPEESISDLFYTPVYEADGKIGGVMCTVVDNSDRAAMEKRVKDSEGKLRRVTDAVPMLISYVDRQLIYRFANHAYERWFGMKPDDMIGKHIAPVIGQGPYKNRRPDIDRALVGEVVTSEADMPVKGGAPRRLEVRHVPHVEADGSIPGVTSLAWISKIVLCAKPSSK
jgi:PAS domain S-box-containing protein